MFGLSDLVDKKICFLFKISKFSSCSYELYSVVIRFQEFWLVSPASALGPSFRLYLNLGSELLLIPLCQNFSGKQMFSFSESLPTKHLLMFKSGYKFCGLLSDWFICVCNIPVVYSWCISFNTLRICMSRKHLRILIKLYILFGLQSIMHR